MYTYYLNPNKVQLDTGWQKETGQAKDNLPQNSKGRAQRWI
jgi:hypothetical protein